MTRKRIVSNLHQLTVREILAAPEGDLSDGGGLILRLRGQSASWVFRYTAATGKRREMGLGAARLDSDVQAGDSVKRSVCAPCFAASCADGSPARLTVRH